MPTLKPKRPTRQLKLVKKLARPQKLTRAAKQNYIRAALLEAAAKVVGEVGYSAAMVSTITRRVGVAQGTFYNYFKSRQDLFDQLLPSMSNQMLAFINERSSHASHDTDREKLRFEAYFAYLIERPEFYRILYESELSRPRHSSSISMSSRRATSECCGEPLTQAMQKRSIPANMKSSHLC